MADPLPNIAEARRRIAEVVETGLDELDLGGLDLGELPEELFALTNLKQLDLGVAKVVPGVPPGRNRLTKLDQRLFATLTKLEFLDLTANELTALPPDIGSLQSLQVLFVVSNKLASLPA